MKTFKKLKIILITTFCCIFFPFFSQLSGYAATLAPETTIKNGVLIHLESGMIMYEKNIDEKVLPAFLPKIMTVILAMEKYTDMNSEILTVKSSAFAGIDYRSADKLKTGEELRVIDLIHCIMLATSNEACNVIAENVSVSTEEFVKLMNQKAAEIGAVNTKFSNSNGLNDGTEQYSTVRDMIKILSYALKIDGFLDISNTKYFEIPKTNLQEQRALYTNNNFLLTNTEFYDTSIQGIKTNSMTDNYSLCSISSKKMGTNKEETLLSIMLFAPTIKNLYTETKSLYNWAFTNYHMQKLVTAQDSLKEMKVEISDGRDFILLLAESDVNGFISEEFDKDKLHLTFDLPDKLSAPIYKNQVIGTVEVVYDNINYGKVNVIASIDIYRSELMYMGQQITAFFSNLYVKIVSVIIILAIMFYVIYAIAYNKRRKRAKANKIRKRIRF